MAKKIEKNKEIPKVIVQNITVRPIRRKSSDIQNWRDAINSFENPVNPNRSNAYDLYSDILLDGHLLSVWHKRQDRITNKELVFVREGIIDENISKLLNSPEMREFLKDLLDTIAWGYTVIQINSITWNELEERHVLQYDIIPRKHVHPEKGFECISKNQQQATKDFLFKEPPLNKYMIWAGDPADMGLLMSAAQYVIYKRGNFGDWAQFTELFGMPFREARYDDFDDGTRTKLEQAMEHYGGSGYAILPKSAEFKIHNSSQGTSGDLYKLLKDACNDEISKIVLGNTLTTEQGDRGARSLGEVHENTEEAKFISDLKFITDILDTRFKSILKLFGFDTTGGNIWFKSSGKDWDLLLKKWNVLSGVATKVPVDDDVFYEEFDIPKPENYEEQKEEMKAERMAYASLSIPKVAELLDQSENKSFGRKFLDFFV